MVTPTPSKEAAKIQQHQHLKFNHSLKHAKVLSLCRTLKEFRKKIARTLNRFNVNAAHKPVKTVGSILKKPKDKFDQDLSTGVVYKISCKDCEKVYIGQTSRTLKSRTREHKRAVFTGDKNSMLAQHCAQTNHDFNFDDVDLWTAVLSGHTDCF